MKDFNFSWLIDGKLAGCARPMYEDELRFLYHRGIRALVRLDEIGFPDVESFGIKDLHDPIPDFDAPFPEQIDRIINFVKENIKQSFPVAVSCGEGKGRTGTIITCYLISEGYSANDAETLLIQKGRKPYESIVQKEAIEEYANRQISS